LKAHGLKIDSEFPDMSFKPLKPKREREMGRIDEE
jgi:hypothetical protein